MLTLSTITRTFIYAGPPSYQQQPQRQSYPAGMQGQSYPAPFRQSYPVAMQPAPGNPTAPPPYPY